MRFFSWFSRITLLLLLFVGVTSASTGDLWSWMDNLNSAPFGYTLSQQVTVTQVTPTSVTISSPALQDDLGNKITKYTVMYSENPLSKILETPALLDQSLEKTFDFPVVNGPLTFQLTTTGDNLDPSKVYYMSIIPKDQNGILGEISNEFWVKLADSASGEGTYAATATSATSHGSAGADMNLAHVSHTINGNTVTLTWINVDGSDKVDIFLRDPNAGVFNKLSTVSMSAEKYAFTIDRNGEFIVNFMPNNGGAEKRYTFTVSGVTPSKTPTVIAPTTKPTITKVPHVGPVENIAVALFAAFILYVLYRNKALRRK